MLMDLFKAQNTHTLKKMLDVTNKTTNFWRSNKLNDKTATRN